MYLCNKCFKNEGLCLKCGKLLVPEEKSKIRKANESSKYGTLGCCVITLLAFIPVIQIQVNAMMSNTAPSGGNPLYSVLGFIGIIVGISFLIYMFYRGIKLKKEVREDIDNRLYGKPMSSEPTTPNSEITSKISNDTVLCLKCGAKFTSKEKFCGKCGNSME